MRGGPRSGASQYSVERDKERASEEHVDGSMEMEEENQKSVAFWNRVRKHGFVASNTTYRSINVAAQNLPLDFVRWKS